MTKLSEIVELSTMLEDFRNIGLNVEVVGSMRRYGESQHDIDLSVEIDPDDWTHKVWRLTLNWDRILYEKYGINLDLFVHMPRSGTTWQICSGNQLHMNKLHRNHLSPVPDYILDETGEPDKDAKARLVKKLRKTDPGLFST